VVHELVALALDQAEKSQPAVRAAALLRIARVQTAFDRDLARKTFQRALDETRQLPGLDGQFLLDQARRFAAAVAPETLGEIPSAGRTPHHIDSEWLGKIMLEHGQQDAAFDYVMHFDEWPAFPFPVVSTLMARFRDDERRLVVFRRAIQAWRAAHGERFIGLFQSQWKVLPPDEARDVVREIVRVTLEHQPDRPVRATYDQEGTVQITSGREHALFQILHVLRHLDEALAESLIAGHQQLATAARRFPCGMESLLEEAEARQKAQGASCGGGSSGGGSGGYVMAGNSRDFAYMKALMQASQADDFAPLIEHALERYRGDTAPENPNQAPPEFWPSTHRFRSILYKAGKRLGADAAIYLDRIPDGDLRLFAQIELAAALAGLPELQGVQREFHPRQNGPASHLRRTGVLNAKTGAAIQSPSRFGPPGALVRCPRCNWSPSSTDRWFCKCGHLWNTFETRGLCPACRYQWEITGCHACGESSPHSEWYVKK
jgi:hypothetical protein